MLAALAAKSDEQAHRRSQRSVASGQRRAASPRTAIWGRPPPIGALAGLISAIKWRADGRPF
jgi:hypothetical protein